MAKCVVYLPCVVCRCEPQKPCPPQKCPKIKNKIEMIYRRKREEYKNEGGKEEGEQGGQKRRVGREGSCMGIGEGEADLMFLSPSRHAFCMVR